MPFVTNDGIKTYYTAEGTGPAVLLHHGLMSSSTIWRREGYADALKDSYTLVMVDSRGHGESDKPHDPAEYAPGKRSSDMIAVLDTLGIEQVSFFGYSMGAKTGYEMCHFVPERVRSLIAGGSAMIQPLGLYESLQPELMLAWFDRGIAKIPPDEVEKRRNELVNTDFEAMRASVHSTTFALTDSYRESLRLLEIPMMFIAGDADPFHDGARALSDEMRNASFVSLPGTDHAAGSQAALPHVVEFLKTVS